MYGPIPLSPAVVTSYTVGRPPNAKVRICTLHEIVPLVSTRNSGKQSWDFDTFIGGGLLLPFYLTFTFLLIPYNTHHSLALLFHSVNSEISVYLFRHFAQAC